MVDHLDKLEKKNKDKVSKYKQFAIDLKQKHKHAEHESTKNYQDFIKIKQEQTDELMNKKEDMYIHLKMATEDAQKELINIKNKLYKAQKEGVMLQDDEEG